MLIFAGLALVASATFFPSGLVANGHPEDMAAEVTFRTSLGLSVAGEVPCETLAQSGDGFRFVVRPWNDGPVIVRVDYKSEGWTRVHVARLAVNADETGFVLESEEARSLPPVQSRVVRHYLAGWDMKSTPYQPGEDGVEVVGERWKSGSCMQIMQPDSDLIATSLLLLGVDPDDVFASGRRKRPHG